MRLMERRIGLLFATFLVLLSIGVVRSLWLGVVRADALKRAAATQQKASIDVPAIRGSITDRHGEELAVSQPAVSIAATPYLIADPLKASKQLAPLLRVPESDLLAKLSQKGVGFAWLARKVPAARAQLVRKLKIAGLEYVPESRRVYPRTFLASQLLGMVGTDNFGLAGLEQAHDSALRGRDGKRVLVKDALGDPIRLREQRRARAGAQLTLTLDARIQEETEQVLAEVGAKWRPRKGATAIVMDPRSSEVLALANWPRVDANNVGDAPEWARQNRATGAAYEPGSTFKVVTVGGALEEKLVTPDTEFQLPAKIQVADREIGEAQGHVFGSLTTKGILEKSSNVGTIKIGQLLTADHFDKWVRRFGFGTPTGVDLPGEEAGILLDRSKYSGSSMGNLPIGQGLAVTPMQMAAAYAAIANGGILRPPRVVKAIGNRQTPLPRGRRVLSPGTSSALRDMLEGVLGPGGTASGAAINPYKLAGKTGTAEKPDPLYGGYSKTNFVASFVGFAPAANPRLLVLVMVDEPEGDIYGGSVAAPAWREITSFALNYLRIPPK
jgi:cell division protein FtsI/penicillin-binding protein 2